MQRLEVTCAVRPMYGSLGAKGLMSLYVAQNIEEALDFCNIFATVLQSEFSSRAPQNNRLVQKTAACWATSILLYPQPLHATCPASGALSRVSYTSKQ
jgi:hypothetical protein